MAIKEFYANLMPTVKEARSSQYGRVWLQNKYYNFSPTTINIYLGIDADDIEDPDIDVNMLTKVIAGGTYSYWPTETNMLPAKSLTTKYAILHKIAMTNWLPSEHRGALNLQMENLIYKIGKGIPINLGNLIFKQVVSFRDPATKENKTFRPNASEPMEGPKVRLIDARLKQGSHVLDIYPEHRSNSAQPLAIGHSQTSQLTAQLLDKSIQDLNTIIQILVEKREVEMQLREELRLREQEMIATTQTAEPAQSAEPAEGNPIVAENVLTSQEAVSSESD
ncbi:uncharacterized protein LOC116005639 [Ipomoea triloba]|uniref:uncharacterized protein LOC116005639 n=1 Tax=Ipomoea triloba TaxID=35885 RepID=UPI00125E2857|nr:uncharacterized protein LOC116005639 [Ipomoea triloba]